MKKNSDLSKLSAYVVVLALLVIMAVGIKGYNIYASSRHPSDMAALEEQLAAKQQAVFDANEEIRKKRLEMMSDEGSVVDASRITRDEGIAEGIMKTVFGWKDYESYISARENLKARYGLSEDDRFLKVFLPYVSESEPTLSGERYNWIDINSYNVYYDGMRQYFLGESEDSYHYLSEVDWSTVATNGGEARRTSVFIYSVDSQGHISHMDGYVID